MTKNNNEKVEEKKAPTPINKKNIISFEDWKIKKDLGAVVDVFKKTLDNKEYSEKELDDKFEKFMNKEM